MKDELSNTGDAQTSSDPTGQVSLTLDNVLITAELAYRQRRSPDYAAEGRALTALAEAMADSPQTILQRLVETALDLCRADSAGISILEPGGVAGGFRWYAVAGQFEPNIGSHLLREASPSGIVLDRDAPLLFSYPERHFAYGRAIDPPIVEALLVPFHNEGKPVGTLWVVAHTPFRKFDTEDQRVLISLSRFASMAYQLKTAALTSMRAKEDVRQILDTADIGLSRCSRDLRYLECNRAYEKLTGLSTAQIVGRPIADIIGAKAFEVIRPYVERVLRGERVEYEEEVPVSLPVSGDEPRFFHVVYEPWFDSEGWITGFIASVSDLTALKRTTTALEEREQRLRLALEASGAGWWMWSAANSRLESDDRFRSLYGFTAEEPMTLDSWYARVVYEEDRPQLALVVEQILNGTKDEWDYAFRIVRPDGTLAWIQSVGGADRGPDGQVSRMSGIHLDITERRRAEEVLQARREEERDRALHQQAEEALRRSHAELEQQTRQLRRLASQLTLTEQSVRKQLASTLHDGLQQILFSAAITLDEAMESNSQDDYAELLQRARTDVKEAMEAARTLSVNLFPPVLHLSGLPAALTWLAKRTQEQYGIAVNLTAIPQANPESSEVRVLLFEAVRELLFNAAKHANADRVDVELTVEPGDTIQIQVSDHGLGFDPATLHHTNQHQVGLGLFSIQERLALLGGHLHIQSAPGNGSRFTLTLPRTGMRSATDGTETPQQDKAWQERVVYDSASSTSQSLRILITDDHAVARAGLRELFGKRPLLQVVGEATNGVEAITQAVALHPDVIVMDVSLPQINGIDATREIHRTLPHIRIVGLSTHHDESTERLMRRAGAEAYFTKNEGTDRLLDYLLALRGKAKGASRM